jgi:uncharacterized repeat protein (TIGR03803 family)
MTELRTHKALTFPPPHSQEGSSLKKLSLPATISIVLLFCTAASIAAPAQNTFFTTLANLDYTNGAQPTAGLLQATDGNLYGTTSKGGTYGGGTVFKITPSGTLTTLYSFCPQYPCTDGDGPYSGLVQSRDGNFYGTTGAGRTATTARSSKSPRRAT